MKKEKSRDFAERMRVSNESSEFISSGDLFTVLVEKCSGDNGQRFRWLKYHKENGFVAQARSAHPRSSSYPNAPEHDRLPDLKGWGSTPVGAMEALIAEIEKQREYIDALGQ